MRHPKLVCRFDITPEGPGVVIEIAGQEAFLPAEIAAEWIAGLGYSVLTPMRIGCTVEPAVRLGETMIVGEEAIRLVEKREKARERRREQRALARILKEHPELRPELEKKGMLDGVLTLCPEEGDDKG